MAREPRKGATRGDKPEISAENLSSVAFEAVTSTPETSIREIVTRIEDVFNGLGTEAPEPSSLRVARTTPVRRRSLCWRIS
jgi:hypothetical protein